MADHLGSFNASSTIYFYFTTHAASGAAVAPSSAFEAADLKIYKNGSATERTSASGITMTSPFDSVTGLHAVAIDLSDNTDASFYAAGSEYVVVLSPDETVDSLAVVKVLAYFSIERVVKVNVTQFGGSAGTFASGRPDVNMTYISGSAVSTSSAQLGVNVVNFGGSAGTFASGRPEVNTSHIAGSSVSTSSAQIGVNVVNAGGTAWGSGAITAGSIATDAIGALELAADAVSEIAAAISVPSASTVAAAVWDLATSGHVTSGTFGEQAKTLLDTIAGYLDTEVAAIKAKTDNLPIDPADASVIAASFSVLASYVDTEVAAIKAKTDNLPAAPAATSDVPSAAAVAAAVWDLVTSGHTTSGTFGEAMSAAGSAGDPWTTSLPATYTSGQAGYILGTYLTAAPPSAATIADAVWDELLSGHLTAGSFGSYLNGMAIHSGNIFIATSTTVRLDQSTASATNFTYDGCWVVLTSGPGKGQARYIVQYIGSNKSCTITPAWTTTPDGTEDYVILPGAYGQAIYGAVGSVTGSVGGSVALVTALDTQAKADVKEQVSNLFNVDTFAEPGQGSPSATTSIFAKINYLYKAWRNKSTQSATDYKLYDNAQSIVDQKASTSNDGTTFTRTEITTGP